MVYCSLQQRTKLCLEWRIFNQLFFEISRGVWQGCLLSPSLFILAVELLALKIRENPDCGSLLLPNNQDVKISQFADDTTTDSLKSHLQMIEWFGTVSGLKLNKKKTKAMWLGTMKHGSSKIKKHKRSNQSSGRFSIVQPKQECRREFP